MGSGELLVVVVDPGGSEVTRHVTRQLALAYDGGFGVPKDAARAAALRERASRLDFTCSPPGEEARPGGGGPKTPR